MPGSTQKAHGCACGTSWGPGGPELTAAQVGGESRGPCALLGLGAGFPHPLLLASAGLGLPLEGFAVNTLSGAWPALLLGVFFALGQTPGSRDLVPTRLRARPRLPLAVLSLCSWVEVGVGGGAPESVGPRSGLHETSRLLSCGSEYSLPPCPAFSCLHHYFPGDCSLPRACGFFQECYPDRRLLIPGPRVGSSPLLPLCHPVRTVPRRVTPLGNRV